MGHSSKSDLVIGHASETHNFMIVSHTIRGEIDGCASREVLGHVMGSQLTISEIAHLSSIKICQEVRSLLLARPTQLMLADAIVGLVAKGVYLAAKHNVLSLANRDQILNQLENTAGTDDITEAVQPLRFRYDFANKFGDVKHGQMPQLFRVTIESAMSERVSRAELLLLKDYSFTFRELSPLFEMLRQARNYYAHNTADREDIGWNGLIISAITRILERGNFLEKKRVEERANLKMQTTQLFDQLINAHTDPALTSSNIEIPYSGTQDRDEIGDGLPPNVIGTIEGLSSDQEELLASAKSIESQLRLVSKQIDELKVLTTQPIASQNTDITRGRDTPHLSSETSLETEVPEKNAFNIIAGESSEQLEKHDFDDEPVLASETLISIDMLYEELEALKDEIKSQYENDNRWRGPSSNFLQRAIITVILANEPASIKEILKYNDVKWRVKKEKELLTEQTEIFGKSINELLSRTAWLRDYQ